MYMSWIWILCYMDLNVKDRKTNVPAISILANWEFGSDNVDLRFRIKFQIRSQKL